LLADDLGYGELGCYGQEKIETPHLDRLAAEGLRFTQTYAGAPVCAPSRCVLMTGRQLSNAYIRGNREVKPEGQWPIPADAVTVPELLKPLGYTTGCVGKWGLGAVGSTGDPNSQGFDFYYGYICQRVAHNYYPPHLWLNGQKHILDNPVFSAHQKLKTAPASYDRFYGNEYAPDRMLSAALAFVRRNQGQPFFLYLPFVEPHVAIQPPKEWVDRYPKEWDPEPYLGQRGYLPHPRPRAGYAAMISHLDDHVGRVVQLIDELGLGEDTLILFSSDNGATHDAGGVDTEFFDSVGPLRGRKGSVYEGGLRVPTIARWTGKITAGATTDHVSGFQDVMPTLVEIAGGTPPDGIDGISFAPTLLGRGEQRQHDHMVWEFFGYGGQQAVRMGQWKAVRRQVHKKATPIELYDLSVDVAESNDVAAEHPDIVARMAHIMRTERTPNADFPIEMLDRR
jgi:arylsulfatase